MRASALRSRAVASVRRVRPWRPYPAVVVPPCELCGSSERLVVGRRVAFQMGYTTVACAHCGLVYICPRPDAASFAHFYRELYPRLYGKTSASVEPSARGRDVWHFLEPHVVDRSAVLDVGCGDASLLRAFAAEAAASGRTLARLEGCDPGWPPTASSTLEEAGQPIEIRPVGVFDLGEEIARFDLVVLYDVLEHLLEPRRFLEQLHENVGQTALLFISTNCLDHVEEIPPAGWETYYLRLAHTFTFTRATLAGLLGASGWEVAEFRQAAKGDQWVLCRRASRVDNPTLGDPAETLRLVERYKERCR